MGGLKRNWYNSLMFMVVTGLTAWNHYGEDKVHQKVIIVCLTIKGRASFFTLGQNNETFEGSCSKLEKKLWAYTNPTTEVFKDTYKKYISSDRGEVCRWVITSSDEDTSIKLTFSNYHVKNSTKSDKGDCVEIYDGEDKKVLDILCDQVPQKSYTSVEGEILVIYRRGEVEGDRQFSMTYSSHSVVSKEKIIQIAGIIGAILATIGLIYVILRVTKCCKCLRTKNNIDSNRSGSTTRERDRLVAQNLEQGGANAENIQSSRTNQPQVPPPSNGAASTSAIQDGTTTIDNSVTVNESDTDSLQGLNEPPPSYESLYLNEVGESVTPPKYSPPQHQSTHPPRRVNTFN